MGDLDLSRWKGAAGLDAIKKDFSFTPAQDQAFALGWPHLRLLTDEPIEPYRPAMRLLKNTEFDLAITWPRDLAMALVRAWGLGQLFDLAPGYREFRRATEEALWALDDLTRPEVEQYLAHRLTKTPMWAGERATESFVLLTEALTDTEWVAEGIVKHLEKLDRTELWDYATIPALITYQLGYLLLRLPKARADAYRKRMRNLVEGNGGLGPRSDLKPPQNPSHIRSLLLVLDGEQAADQCTDKDLRWYTHATGPEGAKHVLMRANINRGVTIPSARLVWIAGPRVLSTRFGGLWQRLSIEDQVWFFDQIRPIKAPQMVPLMLAMAADSPAKRHAHKWLTTHLEFTRPHLEAVADKNPIARGIVG